MKLLIIDNNIDKESWGASELRKYASAGGAAVTTRRAPGQDLPATPEGFDRIVVSGSKTSVLEDSEWVTQLMDFIKRSIDSGKPFLGVCYGHQMLCRTIGGKASVRAAQTPEWGWTEIELVTPSSIFKGLPKKFHSFSWHQDEVSNLPARMKLLARSEICGVQACELSGKPVFGIQFHPERNVSDGNQTIQNKIKAGMSPKLFLNPDMGSQVYDSKIADMIFENFLNL